jgi:hypothetical protein
MAHKLFKKILFFFKKKKIKKYVRVWSVKKKNFFFSIFSKKVKFH